MQRLLLIVGLQKSGTTLLSRLCQEHGVATSPFRTEGNDFFGNEPPFAPTGDPAGLVYQRHGGDRGHEIDAADATEATLATLKRRLRELAPEPGPILNKNPYNSLRLRWLRSLFPDALMVAMVREPVANAYSLAKKYVPHEGRGLPPDEGFWGVRPPGWRDLVREDKLLQSAAHWDAVNRILLRDRHHLDALLPYHRLCAEPARLLGALHERLTGERREFEVEPISCFDDEHQRGSRLRSKNRYFRETGSLQVPDEEEVEFPPLTAAQVDAIREITDETWDKIGRPG